MNRSGKFAASLPAFRRVLYCGQRAGRRAAPSAQESEHLMRLHGKTYGVFVAEGFEDLEFWVPVMRLREEGARVRIIGLALATVTAKHCLTATPDSVASEVTSGELDGLVIPGGWAPDKLRRDAGVLRLVRECHEQGKVIGIICHAGWVAASAGIVRGKRFTGSRGIKDDLENAGATWVDEPAFREGNLVWGRVVEDIPDFCRELVAALVGG
jgi:protease I